MEIVAYFVAFIVGYLFSPVMAAFNNFYWNKKKWYLMQGFRNVPFFTEYIRHEKWRYLYLDKVFFPYGISQSLHPVKALLAIAVVLATILAGAYFTLYKLVLFQSYTIIPYLFGVFVFITVYLHYKYCEKYSHDEIYIDRRECIEKMKELKKQADKEFDLEWDKAGKMASEE